MICKRLVPLFLLTAILLASPVMAQDPVEPVVLYTVDLTDANRHYVTVTADFPSQGETTPIMMAVWTPGSYLIRDYPKHVVDMVATDDKGKDLSIRKTTKSRWVVDGTGAVKRVRVSYRVYCRERSVRNNWVDDQYAMLNGAPTFVTSPKLIESPSQVLLRMPDSWKRSATSMKPSGDRAHQYRAESFHELVDSPIVAGKVEVFPFEVGGVPHALVNVNDQGFWDGSRAIRDLSKIVKAQHEMWGNVPYDRYLFINVIGGGGDGLEHDNSCLLMSGQWTCGSQGSYHGWLSLCSHEFFHVWNVRRLRPRALARYDYENENYTPSLWVAEGVTTYYQDLLLARAGLSEEYQIIGDVSSMVTGLQATPGRLKQSLRDSSHDAWIKHYQPEENSRYNEISYYTKGAVVAWLLDAEIRSATGGAKSLDDVLRQLFKRYAGRKGYTADDFARVCSEVAGTDLSEFFARSVDSTGELDYQTASDWFGLNIGSVRPGGGSARASENRDAGNAEAPRAARARPGGRAGGRSQSSIGASTRTDTGKIVITSVTPESAADLAGLTIDDELLAVEGLRLEGDFDTRLSQYKTGDTVKLLVSRDGRIIEVPVKLAERPATGFWSVSITGSDNKTREARRQSWISGVPLEPKPAEVEPDPAKTEADKTDADKAEADKAATAGDGAKKDGDGGGSSPD